MRGHFELPRNKMTDVVSRLPLKIYTSVVDPHCFNTDPDPVFLYFNVDLDPGSQTNADPNPFRRQSHKRFNFYIKNMHKVVGNR
jgi:hypothetical protein